MTSHELELELARRAALRDAAVQRANVKTNERDIALVNRNMAVQARAFAQNVAQKTQAELEARVSEIATAAMRAVFPEPYEMKVKFELARGKTEARVLFTRGGLELDPMTESGGGPVDVAAFALRLTFHALAGKRAGRNTLILDEPFRFVSLGLQPRLAAMLRELSRRLDMQFIMVTHNQALAEGADTVFHVSIADGVSAVSST